MENGQLQDLKCCFWGNLKNIEVLFFCTHGAVYKTSISSGNPRSKPKGYMLAS